MKIVPLFLGVATGAIAGAAAVLLSTPKSGSEVRISLKSTSNDLRDKLSDIKYQMQDLKNSIGNLTKESKEVIPNAIEEIKADVEQWKNETAPLQAKLQAEISAIQTAIEEMEKTLPKKKETATN